MEIIYNTLNQGDSRYNAPEDERILANFIINEAISLEEKKIPFIKEPEKNSKISVVQETEKYIAKELLKLEDFKDNEIFFERSFLGSRADVLAEANNKIIAVECCSCRINKIIDYLLEADEVWVFTRGKPPWETVNYVEDMQWFIFKRGPKWDETFKEHEKQVQEELKKIKNPLDEL